jgi:hypothetical protein
MFAKIVFCCSYVAPELCIPLVNDERDGSMLVGTPPVEPDALTDIYVLGMPPNMHIIYLYWTVVTVSLYRVLYFGVSYEGINILRIAR